MVPNERLEQILQRFQYLEAAMADGKGDIAKLAKEYSALKPVVEQIEGWRRLQSDIAEAEEMLSDPDMKALAEEELPALRRQLPEAEHALQLALLPRDEADTRAAILEIRPGTGGDEAALFAGDLLRMYMRYAEERRWQVEIIEQQDTELGGQQIRKGEWVAMIYSSANRDEKVFADAHTFDVLRDPNPHLGFGGGGPHFCMGNFVAKKQLRAIFRELVHRAPGLELGEPDYLTGNFVRAVKSMPYTLR